MPIRKNHIQGVSIAIVITLPPLKKHSIHYPCSLWLCDKAKVLNLSLHPDVYLYYRSFVFCGKISHLGCVADCSLFTIVTSFYSSYFLLLLFSILIIEFCFPGSKRTPITTWFFTAAQILVFSLTLSATHRSEYSRLHRLILLWLFTQYYTWFFHTTRCYNREKRFK